MGSLHVLGSIIFIMGICLCCDKNQTSQNISNGRQNNTSNHAPQYTYPISRSSNTVDTPDYAIVAGCIGGSEQQSIHFSATTSNIVLNVDDNTVANSHITRGHHCYELGHHRDPLHRNVEVRNIKSNFCSTSINNLVLETLTLIRTLVDK